MEFAGRHMAPEPEPNSLVHIEISRGAIGSAYVQRALGQARPAYVIRPEYIKPGACGGRFVVELMPGTSGPNRRLGLPKTQLEAAHVRVPRLPTIGRFQT